MTEHAMTLANLSTGVKESRWAGIRRSYTPADVRRLGGSLQIEYTMARNGADELWKLLHREPYVAALGAMTGNQAIEQVRAGLLAVYASSLQAAADANTAKDMFPDASLNPSDSVPNLVRNINKSLQRADQIHHADGTASIHWFAPVVADAGAGCGCRLSTFELTKAMIEAGAAAVHLGGGLLTTNRCHLLEGIAEAPTQVFIEQLIAARLAADVMNVPTLLIACPNGNTAYPIESEGDSDLHDHELIEKERVAEGDSRFRVGIDAAIACAPYADVLCNEAATPDLKEARRFAEAIHKHFPGKLLAYHCSPSSNWVNQLDTTTIRNFSVALSGMGYKLQFVTLAGFHSLNLAMFDLARDFRETGMAAYARLQETEFELARSHGYEAVRHSRFTGIGYFEDVAHTISRSAPSATARRGSTEEA
jgi:isocitrate lyase